MQTTLPPIIILHGPTASGKSALAVNVAKKIDAVIINADSMQVYDAIPIVTAQPTKHEQQHIAHHLYGHVSVNTHYSVAHWLNEVVPLIHQIRNQHITPILVGGTGMYIKSLIDGIAIIPDIPPNIREEAQNLYQQQGPEAFHAILSEYDPALAQKLPPGDTQRMLRAYEVAIHTGIPLSAWQQQKPTPFFPSTNFKGFFLHPPREEIYNKCNKRFEEMTNNGLEEEIKQLLSYNLSPSLPAMKALGVPEISAYIQGTLTKEDAITQAQTKTRHYVKRQLTWQRNQFPEFHILEKADAEEMIKEVIGESRS